MEEDNNNNLPLNQRLCRFFSKSRCFERNRCLFSHDRNTPVQDNVCRFFLKDKCAYGATCKYEHISVSAHESTQESSKNNTELPAAKNYLLFSPEVKNTAMFESEENVPVTSDQGNRPRGNCSQDIPEFLPINSTESFYVTTENADKDKKGDSMAFKEGSSIQTSKLSLSIRNNCIIQEIEKGESSGASSNINDENQDNSEVFESNDTDDKSAAIERSLDKVCGICFEIVMEKQQFSERSFGILEKCNHVFCKTCIRKWRQVRSLYSVSKKCPECRVFSNFFVPNLYWVEDEEEKAILLDNYKEKMSRIACKFFKQGRGYCRNRDSCFYLHTFPDGTRPDYFRDERFAIFRLSNNQGFEVSLDQTEDSDSVNDLEGLRHDITNILNTMLTNLSNRNAEVGNISDDSEHTENDDDEWEDVEDDDDEWEDVEDDNNELEDVEDDGDDEWEDMEDEEYGNSDHGNYELVENICDIIEDILINEDVEDDDHDNNEE